MVLFIMLFFFFGCGDN